eukprot:408302-Ditylum_brightwellii.AAC.1
MSCPWIGMQLVGLIVQRAQLLFTVRCKEGDGWWSVSNQTVGKLKDFSANLHSTPKTLSESGVTTEFSSDDPVLQTDLNHHAEP